MVTFGFVKHAYLIKMKKTKKKKKINVHVMMVKLMFIVVGVSDD
jgi:hypothetical protein